jgi:hypothetical protein
MTTKELDDIINLYQNGSVLDFKARLNALNKLDLLQLIDHWRGWHNTGINYVMAVLRQNVRN